MRSATLPGTGMETRTRMKESRSDEITPAMERKSDAYAEFLSATLLLKKALETEEMAAVTRLIERRAELILVVDALDREIVHGQKIGPCDRNGEGVRKTAVLSADLGGKLRQILSTNQDCRAIAADRLSLLQKELQHIHEKEDGLHGYLRPAQPMPKFLNVRT